MRTKVLYILSLLFCYVGFAQQEFHVTVDGKSTGDGSLNNPWDLQSALNQNSEIINDGDYVFIHKGVYNGRFISKLASADINKPITVSNFENDEVILNGNIQSNSKSVLEVKGKNVVYENFIVTFLGNFNRDQKTSGFLKVDGINHTSGTNCKFINIKIHNNPGSGLGSWKFTGGSKIFDCIIYNNGFMSKAGRGGGVGLYVQNASDQERFIGNNIIFNNYYKGIEVWSANKNADNSYVKNITISGNTVFNNGAPAGVHKDNLIIASDDRNQINVPNNIKVLDNIFYHNTELKNGQVGGDAASVSIGFNANSAPTNVMLKNNIIIGRNNAFRILSAKSLEMENNTVYCGYIHLNPSVLNYFKEWKLKNNIYYTKRLKAFRITKDKDYQIEEWKRLTDNDNGSKWLLNKEFVNNIKPRIKQFYNKKNTYSVAILDSENSEVSIDFSNYKLNKGSNYKIFDVENLKEPLKTGILDENNRIIFDIGSSDFERPTHNEIASKTNSNFGIFIVEFNPKKVSEIKEKSTLGKLLDMLGF